MTQSGIFIVMKYPEIGKVKMRLAESIGEEAATGLYRAFIQDILSTVQSLEISYHIAVHPPESQDEFAEWLGSAHQYFQQRGADLGERLKNGFRTMFEKDYQQVIALASDSPDLPIEILREAVIALQTHEIVIGPATDGGYYLIGFSRDCFIPEAFEGISWSTASVLEETLTRIGSINQQIHSLPEWADVDTIGDLQKFFLKHKNNPSMNLHTMLYLRSNPSLQHILGS